MDERQKTRLIMLAVSGLFLGAGGYGYMWYQEQKAAQLAEEEGQQMQVQTPVRKKPADTTTTASTTDTTDPTKTAAVTPPAVTGDDIPPPVIKQATPPVVAQAPINVRPVVKAAPVEPAAATPPVTAAQAPAPAVAVTPKDTQSTPPAQGAPADATAQTAALPQPTPSKLVYPATTEPEAAAAAAVGKGRPIPTQPIAAFLPWPTVKGAGAPLDDKKPEADALLAMVPPPPSPDKPTKPKKINEKLVPPPPPEGAANGLAGLPIDQLPVPPSRPTIGDKMRVLGVFDDRAIISFPKAMASKNKWPKTINLGTGEQFESLTIVSINRDGVTIEEDGERTLKPLHTVK